MTTTDIAYRANVPERSALAEHERWIPIYAHLMEISELLTRGPFATTPELRDKQAVFSVLLCGHGLGLEPIAALRSIAFIRGKPYIDTSVLVGLALRAGHTIQWGSCTEKSASVRVVRGDGRSSAEITYTWAQAERAGYTSKDNWRRMPAEMLRARAVRAALTMVAPDIALGIETFEPPPAPIPGMQAPEPPVTIQIASEQSQPEPETPPVEQEPSERLITQAQQRKLNAMLNDLERARGERMTRDERRTLIISLAGLPPGAITSASQLTASEASAAIEALADHQNEATELDSRSPDVPEPRNNQEPQP
jgi:hypothetical protein